MTNCTKRETAAHSIRSNVRTLSCESWSGTELNVLHKHTYFIQLLGCTYAPSAVNTAVSLWRLLQASEWSAAYLPPLARPWKFFRRLYMKRCISAIFQQELQNSTMFDGLLCFQISEKWANLRFPLNIQKQKVFQLALRALAMAPLCQILNTSLRMVTNICGFEPTSLAWAELK